jgi:N-acetyltransferase
MPAPLDRITLTGPSIRLEPLASGHEPALATIAAGDRTSFGFTFVPHTREDVARYVETALSGWERGEMLPFAIVRSADERIVGSTRFGHVERWDWPPGSTRARTPESVDAVEIGWTWLAPDVQRSSVNTECKRLLLGHAFEGLGALRVTLITDVRNARSRAAIERLGAHLDGILRSHFPAADGTIRDTATYSIVAREWPEVRARLDARLAAPV